MNSRNVMVFKKSLVLENLFLMINKESMRDHEEDTPVTEYEQKHSYETLKTEMSAMPQ